MLSHTTHALTFGHNFHKLYTFLSGVSWCQITIAQLIIMEPVEQQESI
jgi:hypothetical protein